MGLGQQAAAGGIGNPSGLNSYKDMRNRRKMMKQHQNSINPLAIGNM